MFQFYQLQNNILEQDEVLLFSILSHPPPAPRYRQELPQIIGIILILKITTKFTVSPSCLIRVVSCKLVGGFFVFPRLGFITKRLSVQADLCFLESLKLSSFASLTGLLSPRLILHKHSAKFKVPLYCYPYYCCDCFILNDLMFFRSYAQFVRCERKSCS